MYFDRRNRTYRTYGSYRSYSSDRVLLFLIRRRRGRLTAGDVHEVLADHRPVLRRQGAGERLLDHLSLPGRQVDKCPVPLHVVEPGGGVLQLAVRLTIALALLLVLLGALTLLRLALTGLVARLLALPRPRLRAHARLHPGLHALAHSFPHAHPHALLGLGLLLGGLERVEGLLDGLLGLGLTGLGLTRLTLL